MQKFMLVLACLTVCQLAWADGVAPAATTDQRLKAVEKKTGFYEVKKVDKSKAWNKLKNQQRATDNGILGSVDVVVNAESPVIVNAWIHLTADFTSEVPDPLIQLRGGPANPAATPAPNLGVFLCAMGKVFPGTSGTIDHKMFCQGVVNSPDQIFRVQVVTVDSHGQPENITLTNAEVAIHSVNQVITEPPPE